MRNSDMRTNILIAVFGLMLAPICGGPVHAQSETDRLREALRSAVTQARTLEDQLAGLQAKQAESSREIERLKHGLELAKAQVKSAEKAQAEAVEEFNKRLEERNELLEKWKIAYEEAASVARAKDVARAKFEAESKSCKARAKDCAARNIKLVSVGNDLLQRLESVQLSDIIAAHEPLFGFNRVEIRNLLQDYQDKILEQRATP